MRSLEEIKIAVPLYDEDKELIEYMKTHYNNHLSLDMFDVYLGICDLEREDIFLLCLHGLKRDISNFNLRKKSSDINIYHDYYFNDFSSLENV